MKNTFTQLADGMQRLVELYVDPFIASRCADRVNTGYDQLKLVNEFNQATAVWSGRPGQPTSSLGLTDDPADYVRAFQFYCAEHEEAIITAADYDSQ